MENVRLSEPSVQYMTRVPVSLSESAISAAQRQIPGISRSGAMRLALALLAGLPDAHAYAANLSSAAHTGPKAPGARKASPA